MLAIIQGLLGEPSKGFYVCSKVLQANGGGKDSSQILYQWETEHAHLVLREGCSFRDLTRWYITYFLARGGRILRYKEMKWGRDVPDQDLFPSFNGACSISDTVKFNRSNLYKWSFSSSLLPRGVK